MKNLTSGFLLLSLGVVLASACGGNSTAFTGAGGSSGKGGAGGAAGKAGATTGGTGGSAGSATTGGSAGKGGSSTGGSSGKGGSAGSGTGGSGEAGEGASGGTGGSAMAGSGGMAGTGAMTGYRPPDSQIDGCTLMCAAAVEAMCENGESLAQCQEGCRFGIRLEACSDQWDEFFECTGDSEPECDADGEVTWPDCVAEYAAIIGCAYDDAMDPDLEAPCEGFCAAQDDLMCTNSPSAADCRNECGLVGAAVPVCKTQYMTYLACAGDADFTCDMQGDPQPQGCTAAGLPFLACVVTEYDIMF